MSLTISPGAKIVPWPRQDETAIIEGVCTDKDTILTISVTKSSKNYAPSQPKCFVGKPGTAADVTMGFKDDCNDDRSTSIDNAIATFTCPKGKLTVKDLRLDAGLDVADWLN